MKKGINKKSETQFASAFRPRISTLLITCILVVSIIPLAGLAAKCGLAPGIHVTTQCGPVPTTAAVVVLLVIFSIGDFILWIPNKTIALYIGIFIGAITTYCIICIIRWLIILSINKIRKN